MNALPQNSIPIKICYQVQDYKITRFSIRVFRLGKCENKKTHTHTQAKKKKIIFDCYFRIYNETEYAFEKKNANANGKLIAFDGLLLFSLVAFCSIPSHFCRFDSFILLLFSFSPFPPYFLPLLFLWLTISFNNQ